MGRVLLVEDENIIAMLTEDMLGDMGFEVGVSAATLSQGLKAASAEKFDFAVLDINLRGELSYPIADILIERGIPFIFASGYVEGGIDPRYRTIPALKKPFNLEGLRRIIFLALANLPS